VLAWSYGLVHFGILTRVVSVTPAQLAVIFIITFGVIIASVQEASFSWHGLIFGLLSSIQRRGRGGGEEGRCRSEFLNQNVITFAKLTIFNSVIIASVREIYVFFCFDAEGDFIDRGKGVHMLLLTMHRCWLQRPKYLIEVGHV
jgi:hypothetical protein